MPYKKRFSKNKPNIDEETKLNIHVKKEITDLLWRFEQPDSLNLISKAVSFKKGISLPSDKYSLLNKCIMYAHDTVDCRGYHTWKSIGRKCLKGKSFHVIAPKIFKVKDKIDPDKTKTILCGFNPILVWPYEGTEGKEIDYKCDQDLPDFHFQKVAKHLNLKITQGFENKLFNGFFNPEQDEICLATNDQKTFCHELVHAVHNKLKKEATGKGLKGGQHAGQEIIAEFSAVVLCNMLGLKVNEKRAYDYISEYSKKTKKKTIRGVAEFLPKIEKIIKYILKVNSEI